MLEAYTLSQSYDRLLEEHKALQSQLTEKDATIKRLEKENQWLYGKLNQIGMLVERGRSEEGDKE